MVRADWKSKSLGTRNRLCRGRRVECQLRLCQLNLESKEGVKKDNERGQLGLVNVFKDGEEETGW